MGKAVENISVTISDKAEKTYTANTDENGRIVVPPVNEDITDTNGSGAAKPDITVTLKDKSAGSTVMRTALSRAITISPVQKS